MKLTRRDFLKLGGLAALYPLARRAASGDRAPSGNESLPNFLVIVLDTLSARHMSLYGYGRETTPNIARFAQQSVVYRQHRAAGNFTTPGTASLLTGTYPWSHRAIHPSSPARAEFAARSVFHILPPQYHKLAYTQNYLAMYLLAQFRGALGELLPLEALTLGERSAFDRWLQQDYILADTSKIIISGLVEPPTSLFLSLIQTTPRFTRAERQDYAERFPLGLPGGDQFPFLLEDTVDWLTAHLPRLPQPYFTYFHLMPPHEPYRPRREFLSLFDKPLNPPAKPPHPLGDSIPGETLPPHRRAYDQFIAYADAEFGRLYDTLAASGQLDNTYLILTSDHGQLFERGIHGHITPVMYEPLLHIPLIIRPPGGAARLDVTGYTSAADLLPTFAALTGQPAPAWAEGRVLPGFAGVADPDRAVYALDAKGSSVWGALRSGTAVMYRPPYKLIRTFGYAGFTETYELFDLQADPEELENIFSRERRVGEEMRKALAMIK
jgi:arylsulfatase A-like enzyme